jgi:4-amino-4-deoxy-L-arabinose transferase-like glycosyltransferase
MTLLEAPAARQKADQPRIRAHTLLALWIAALVLLTLLLGHPPVTRTQEARVLETARQMLGHPIDDWLIPKLNGSPRLQKPPLTYWMSAAGFSVGGINECAGRLATVFAGWLTLAATYLGAKWIFSQRAGLIASAALLGSYFFYRHSRLAETDVPAMLFVTIAILAAWRAADESPTPVRDDHAAQHTARFARQALWFHAFALSTALAILSKGAPGAFAALFLVALILIERRWSLAWAFVKSGAPLTLAIVARPWFVYVGQHEGWGTFAAELNNNMEGGDHGGWAMQYIPELFVATAPWCGLVPIALFAAIKQRRDVRMRRILIWLLAIAVPLCLEGNKQKHYLIPLMPPMMILIGWLIDRAIDRTDGIFGLTRVILWITIPLMFVASLGVLVASRVIHQRIGGLDIIVAIGLILFAVLCAGAWHRRVPSGIAAMLGSGGVLMALIAGLWAPALARNTARETASQLDHAFGAGPYAFVGTEISLPLCWELRAAIPRYDAESDVLPVARSNPSLAVLVLAKDKRPPVQLSLPFVKQLSVRSEDRTLEVYKIGH